METVEIKINDQLFVNGKWYFDVIDINENIVQVRVQYKENNDFKDYLYKSINLDKDLFEKVETIDNTNLINCEIDENKLRRAIGNLMSRLRIEMDYSFMFEDVGVATAANSAGFGDVSMPGINSTPGAEGSAGSGDISTTLGGSTVTPVPELGEPWDKHKKRKKKKPTLKSPIIHLESVNLLNMDSELKTNLLNIMDYPAENAYDHAFITDMTRKKDILMGRSKEVIVNYVNDLVELNKHIYDECSDWLKNELDSIKNEA